jgi:hypothetical protein
MKRLACVGILLFCLPPLLHAQQAQQPQFLRVKEDDGKVTALEIAVTRYSNRRKDLTVDLVGVVHIADRAYYQQLNKRLAEYDAVLYELVAPPGTRVPEGGKKDSTAAMLASLMTTFLGLDSQLACIDYRPKHFIHADLSFEGMMEAARERGETGLTLGLSLLSDMLRKQNVASRKKDREPGPPSDVDFAAMLANPNLLKRDLARQLVGEADLGPTLQLLLVADRNKMACEVLAEQIAGGKKKIAIFYGAAHMPDFDRRLREEFSLRRQSQDWLTAWDLRDDSKSDPALRLKSLLEKLIEK